MSSLFELEDRLRRLREALAYLKRTTLSHAEELRIAAQANAEEPTGEEWSLFLAELRDYAAMAEALGAPAKRRRRAPPTPRPPKPIAVPPGLRATTLH